MQLYLVGVVHSDFDGPRRLTSLLEQFRPDVITVEMDEPRVESIYREKKMVWEQGLENVAKSFCAKVPGARLDSTERYLEISGFEYLAPVEYARRRNIGVLLADWVETNEYSCEAGDASANEVAATSWVWEILRWSPSKIREQYEWIYSMDCLTLTQELLQEMPERDAIAEEVIRAQQGTIVHVGGVGHIFGNYENLADRLRDLAPTRVKLDEADLIALR